MKNKNSQKHQQFHVVDVAIKEFGAEVTGVEETPREEPPFPCLTGASNTSNRDKIDKNMYPDIIAAGVDTLELDFGVSAYHRQDNFGILNDAKSEAVSGGYKARKGVPVKWFGKEFMIQARGSRGGYEYLLQNGDIAIQIMPEAREGKPSPELRVVFRSPYLWRVGESRAYDEVMGFLESWSILAYCKVSRADLCTDRIMPLPEINRKKQVVSMIREKDLYYGGDFQRGQRETGYQFGKGGIVCRLYDKAYEISVKGQGHIIPIWIDNGYDGTSEVTRLELQLRRDGLRLFDPIMDFNTFQTFKRDIWDYGTNRFLRIVNPDSATRKERAKPTDYWVIYQNCNKLFGEPQGVLPHREFNLDWKPLVNQAAGCMASAWARLAADVGEDKATIYLETEWGQQIPDNIILAGMLQKARFMHLN